MNDFKNKIIQKKNFNDEDMSCQVGPFLKILAYMSCGTISGPA